ncbi:MAG TPA: HlyD family efflux transporter periplasmic adaptor subunit [Myxococcota bacterium]|nr:HlyD family efflux transporter periplasmic adaptor subunit [Myxococcota bacterium]
MRRWLVAACLGLAAGACRRDVASIPAVGTLERDRIELTAEENEPIVSVPVKEGDVVAAGEVLMALDDRRLAAQLARARASRDELAARLAELEKGPRAERIREARARLAGAESEASNAQSEFDRSRALERQAVESAARRDQMRMQRDAAVARRDQARATLEELERGTRLEQIDQARGALAAAAATVDEIQVRFERLTVRAPRLGRVDSLPFKLGERPPAGAVVVVMLAADPTYARVYVPEAVRVRIAEGTRASVTISGRDGALDGRVRDLSHEAAFTPYFALTQHDRGRLSYLAEVDVSGPDVATLPTGVPVEVRFELETRAVSAK